MKKKLQKVNIPAMPGFVAAAPGLVPVAPALSSPKMQFLCMLRFLQPLGVLAKYSD